VDYCSILDRGLEPGKGTGPESRMPPFSSMWRREIEETTKVLL
jgi:hypothetical protein